jgi:TPR repeat protein
MMFRKFLYSFALVVMVAGPARADFNGALELYRNGEYEEAFAEWKALAETGHDKSQSNIGLMYRRGQGIEKNEHEAIKWFLKAAEQGLDTAQFNLGILYSRIEGIEQDQAAATKWYLAAAEQGHTVAQWHLAQRYEKGLGADRDFVEALKWAIISSERARGRLKEQVTEYRDKLLERMPKEQVVKASDLAEAAKKR